MILKTLSGPHKYNLDVNAVSVSRAFDILELEPENGNLTLAIALIYKYQGQSQSSLEYIERTHQINPAYPSYCHDRGKTLFGMETSMTQRRSW